MKINLQPVLENERFLLQPLQNNDLEDLYKTASDPKIWEQHPNRNRWKRDVFSVFFAGALESGGAFKIIDKSDNGVAGCTRYYNYDKEVDSIFIGYTFYAVKYWGKGMNNSVKVLMLDYIFRFVSKVYFHVGAANIRSQIAVSRLGATKIKEQEVAYHGESPRLNYLYLITKDNWTAIKQHIK